MIPILLCWKVFTFDKSVKIEVNAFNCFKFISLRLTGIAPSSGEIKWSTPCSTRKLLNRMAHPNFLNILVMLGLDLIHLRWQTKHHREIINRNFHFELPFKRKQALYRWPHFKVSSRLSHKEISINIYPWLLYFYQTTEIQFIYLFTWVFYINDFWEPFRTLKWWK